MLILLTSVKTSVSSYFYRGRGWAIKPGFSRGRGRVLGRTIFYAKENWLHFWIKVKSVRLSTFLDHLILSTWSFYGIEMIYFSKNVTTRKFLWQSRGWTFIKHIWLEKSKSDIWLNIIFCWKLVWYCLYRVYASYHLLQNRLKENIDFSSKVYD